MENQSKSTYLDACLCYLYNKNNNINNIKNNNNFNKNNSNYSFKTILLFNVFPKHCL